MMIELLSTYLLSSLIIYFFPFILSLFTGHRIGAVFAMNLLLGWTLVGWFWALFWALSTAEKRDPNILNNNISDDRAIRSGINQNDQEDLTEKKYTQVKLDENKKLENIHSHQNMIIQLKHLKTLYDNGILTEVEFKKQKSKILNS
jgi:hypothetical protein